MKQKPTELESLEAAIAALESQRERLGSAVLDAALAPLQGRAAQLQALPAREGLRKQVTVLFADVSGFTALSENMDAEDVGALMAALWLRLDGIISAHGGWVDKHMGDAVLALWGAEVAREDDPERAIHAALAMQMELRRSGSARRSLNVSMRIGIHTGPAFLGAVGKAGEYTAVGDTVNLASRLQHVAPVGSIAISHDTYRHVRGVFNVSPIEPVTLKGKSAPVRTYLVRDAKPRAFRLGERGIEGVEASMVGRERELETIQREFRTCAERSLTRLITVVGEAGVGKSRLLFEFAGWSDLMPMRMWFFKGRAPQGPAAQPYGLLRSLFTFRFEILDSDGLGEARTKLEEGFTRLSGGAAGALEDAHLIGHLIGIDFSKTPQVASLRGDGEQFRAQAHEALVRFFSRLAPKPTIMLLEDLQWADERSLDALEHLARVRPDLPLLILGASRPDFFERRPGWCRTCPGYAELALHPLSVEDTGRLVSSILQKAPSVPEHLRELLVRRSEGNPFFVEELVKMLIDDGVILPGEEVWEVDARSLRERRIPQTLVGVLQARLDALQPSERLALQRASVVGRVFWQEAVAKLGAGDGSRGQETSGALESLARREMIYRRPESSLHCASEYVFRHALLRDVAYESVLKSRRGAWHARAAEWILAAARTSGRLNEYLGTVAEHYEKAGKAPRALDFLSRAGQRALQVSAYSDAVSLFERALKWVEGPPAAGRPGRVRNLPRKRELLMYLGQAHLGLSDYASARPLLVKSLALARLEEDRQTAAKALGRLGRLTREQGDTEGAWSFLEESLAAAVECGDRESSLYALNQLGYLAFITGDYGEARRYRERALGLSREMGDLRGAADSLSGLGVIALTLGNYAEARRHLDESLDLSRQTHHQRGQARALINLGEIDRAEGRLDSARGRYAAAMAIAREIGSRQMCTIALFDLGMAEMALGEEGQAEVRFLDALALSRDLGARPLTVLSLCGFAALAVRRGDPDGALEFLGLAIAHPAKDSEVLREAEPLLADLQKKLPPARIEEGLRRGKSLDLDERAAALLGHRAPT